MSKLEKVPWSCEEEWEHCRNHLFGDNPILQQKALEHLYVWKIRNCNLPVAVECTLILMEVKVKEIQLENVSTQEIRSSMSFESWYSMAIMRFLNLIIDPNIRLNRASSMMDFVRQIGIPEWVVELRHTAAHGHSLPSLPRLKEATEICLNWLYRNYWLKGLSNNNEEFDNSVFSVYRCFQACKILKLYILRRCNVMADLSENDRKVACCIMPEKLRREVENPLDSWRLVDAYEIAYKKLFRLMNEVKNVEELVDHIVDSDQTFLSTDTIKDHRIRKSVLKQWADILSVICNSSGCFYLLKRLFHIIASELEESWRRDCAFAYVNEVLESILLFRKNKSDGNTTSKRKRIIEDLKHRQLKHNIAISEFNVSSDEIKELILIISDEPNRYSDIILKSLCNISDGYKYTTTYKKLAELIAIYNGESNSETTTNAETKIHTLEELLGVDYESVPSQTDHHLSEETLWSKVPLGLLPWQTKFHTWLRIYDTNETNQSND